MQPSSITISLSDFEHHSLQSNGDAPAFYIGNFIHEILQKNSLHNAKPFSLPPIMTLAKTFKVTHIVIYDALQNLRLLGYDYRLQHMDEPILIWEALSYQSELPLTK